VGLGVGTTEGMLEGEGVGDTVGLTLGDGVGVMVGDVEIHSSQVNDNTTLIGSLSPPFC